MLEPGEAQYDSLDDEDSELSYNNYDADEEDVDEESSIDEDYTSQFHENLVLDSSDDDDRALDDDDDPYLLINLPFVNRHRASSI